MKNKSLEFLLDVGQEVMVNNFNSIIYERVTNLVLQIIRKRHMMIYYMYMMGILMYETLSSWDS